MLYVCAWLTRCRSLASRRARLSSRCFCRSVRPARLASLPAAHTASTGPCGQGAEALLHLGQASLYLFPTISTLPGSGVPQLSFPWVQRCSVRTVNTDCSPQCWSGAVRRWPHRSSAPRRPWLLVVRCTLARCDTCAHLHLRAACSWRWPSSFASRARASCPSRSAGGLQPS